MKQRILLRLFDRVRPSFSSQVFPSPNLYTRKEYLDTRQYKGIDYRFVVETKYVPNKSSSSFYCNSFWNVDLVGIPVRRFRRSSLTQLIEQAFNRVVAQSSNQHFSVRCGNGLSIRDLDGPVECDYAARCVIDAYLSRKADMDRLLNEVERVYPVDWEESKSILNLLK